MVRHKGTSMAEYKESEEQGWSFRGEEAQMSD